MVMRGAFSFAATAFLSGLVSCAKPPPPPPVSVVVRVSGDAGDPVAGAELQSRGKKLATTAADGTPLRSWLVLPTGTDPIVAEPAAGDADYAEERAARYRAAVAIEQPDEARAGIDAISMGGGEVDH